MTAEHPLMGVRAYHGTRALTIGESYVGTGREDPSGYYYEFDDQPGITHWISVSALSIRFTREPTT